MADEDARLLGVVVGTDEMDARLNTFGTNAQEETVEATLRTLIAMQTWVRTEELHGQVLNQRTGTLAGSVTYEVRQDAEAVIGRFHTGAEAWYGVLHEYGFTYWREPHLRMQKVFHEVMGEYDVYPVEIAGKQITIKERPFMRPALARFEPRWKQEIDAGLARAALGSRGQRMYLGLNS